MLDDPNQHEEELRELKLIEWNYNHARDHFIGFIEALSNGESMDEVIDYLEEVAVALNISVDLEEIESGLDAL